MNDFVFVYGTLKLGEGNNSLLNNAEFITETITTQKYGMVSNGSFPAVIESGNDGYISGELYYVDLNTFDNLDVLEANGYLYHRKLINVKDFEIPVWIYFIINEVTYKGTDGIVVKDDVIYWNNLD